MGNIVNIRSRLEALEQKRATERLYQSKAERDAAFDAWLERLEAMSDDELDATERTQMARIDDADVSPRGIPKLNQKAAIGAVFNRVRCQ